MKWPQQRLSTCSSMFICFCKQQLWLGKINHLIYFTKSQLLLVKTNEHRTTIRKPLLTVLCLIVYGFAEGCRRNNSLPQHQCTSSKKNKLKMLWFLFRISSCRDHILNVFRLVFGNHIIYFLEIIINHWLETFSSGTICIDIIV